jgi:hypothetical protein
MGAIGGVDGRPVHLVEARPPGRVSGPPAQSRADSTTVLDHPLRVVAPAEADVGRVERRGRDPSSAITEEDLDPATFKADPGQGDRLGRIRSG